MFGAFSNVKFFLIFFILFINTFFHQINLSHAINPLDNWALSGSYFTVYPVYYTASKLKNSKGESIHNKLNAKTYSAVLKYTYYNKSILEKTLGFTMLLPAGRKELLSEHNSGIGDLTFGLGYWFIDDPVSKTYLVLGSYVDMPIGDYDKDMMVNIGENVWKIRPAIGMAKQLNNFDIEASIFYKIFTKNKDTDIKKGNSIIFEAYIGYSIKPNVLIGSKFNAEFEKDNTLKGHKIHDSGLRRFLAGPSIFWKACDRLCITLNILKEFDNRNTSQGYLITNRFAWRF